MDQHSPEWRAAVRQTLEVLNQQGLHVAGITSPTPDTGVSRLVRALAQASNEAGQRTLLLAFNGAADDAASPPYDVMGPSGWGDVVFSLNNAQALKAAFARFGQYEAVFVDLPPVLDTRGDVNAITVARACDGVVLVCLAGRVTSHQVLQANEMMTLANITIAGTILNEEVSPPFSEELARAAYRMTWFAPKLGRRLYQTIAAAPSLQGS